MSDKSYKDPILAEQFAEMYLSQNVMNSEKIIDFVPAIKSIGFEQVEMGELEEVIFDLKPSGKPIQRNSTPRIRCWNREKDKLVQLFADRIVVHQVGSYKGWDDFKNLFESVLNISKSNLPNFLIESIALTTMDRFEVPSKDFVISEYLNCSGAIIPKWYDGSTSSADITLGSGLLNDHNNRNRQIFISVKIGAGNTTINARGVFQSLVSSTTPQEVLELLHDESNETFESIITDTTRKKVMGGYK